MHWESVTPPETPANGRGRDVVAGADSLIVAMSAAGSGSIWRSVDDGATWSPATVELDSAPLGWMVESLARLDDRLVGVGTLNGDTGPALLTLVSSDDGVTWTSPPADGSTPGGDGFGSRVVAAAGAFWISMSERNDGFSNPEACYRDLLSCQSMGSRPVLLRSADGLEWVEIDLAAFSTSWIESIVDLADQGVMLVGSLDGTVQLETWTWPSAAEPPRPAPPVEPPADEPPLVRWDGELTVGSTYRFPLYIHCGMGLLGNFNDRWWFLVAGSTEWDSETDPAEAAPGALADRSAVDLRDDHAGRCGHDRVLDPVGRGDRRLRGIHDPAPALRVDVDNSCLAEPVVWTIVESSRRRVRRTAVGMMSTVNVVRSPARKPPWRVFVSHTTEFSQYPVSRSYVAAVGAAIGASGHVVVDMEGFPVGDQTPAALCEDEVRKADVYVGVFGLRYGSPVRDRPDVSYTELEFDCATNVGLPRLIFVLDEQSTEHRIPAVALFDANVERQRAFVRRVQDSGLTTAPFGNVDDLEKLVERALNALQAWQREQAHESPVVGEAARIVPHQLPGGTRGFVGRQADLQILTRLLEETQVDAGADGVPIAAVFGGAGIGKTTLALQWAHRVADRFPDGQLYVNLRGFDAVDDPIQPAAAIRGFLGAFGLNSERIPQSFEDQAALYRTLLWDRWVLVVLDNARDEAQLYPLLPGKGFVLVTSRNSLRGLLADGAQPIALDLLSEEEAIQLFTRYVGADRATAEPGAIQDLVKLTSRLPLAIAVVGSRAQISESIPVSALVAQLRSEPDLLDALEAGDISVSVQSVFSWSYRGFTPDAARLFRLIGLHAGPDISGNAAAALVGMAPRDVQSLLGELTRAHFLQEFRPGRFRSHDLLQAYATKLAMSEDSEDERHAALLRVFDYYLHTGFSADQQLYPYRHPITLSPPQPAVVPRVIANGEEAWAWFTEEIATLLAVTAYAAAHNYLAHAWQLPWTFATFLHRQGGWHDYAASQELALTAAERTEDPATIARVERNIGRPYTLLGLVDDAVAHYERALVLCHDTGDQPGEALCEDALTWQYGRIGRHADAITHAERALALWAAAENKAGRARALNYIGWNRARLGMYEEALEPCEEALQLFREISNEVGEADTVDSIGYAYQHLRDTARAVDFYRRSITLWHQLGDRYNEADVLNRLGDVHRDAGELGAAAEAWGDAVTILLELSHPEAAAVQAKLDAVSAATESPVE